jgi:hypothetical protein
MKNKSANLNDFLNKSKESSVQKYFGDSILVLQYFLLYLVMLDELTSFSVHFDKHPHTSVCKAP